jgi:hypothetical protein
MVKHSVLSPYSERQEKRQVEESMPVESTFSPDAFYQKYFFKRFYYGYGDFVFFLVIYLTR